MKKIVLIPFLLLLFVFVSNAQKSEQIIVKSNFWTGVSFEKGGKTYKFRNILPQMESKKEAYKLMKSAKSNYDVSMLFGIAGGALVGWPLGTSFGGGDPNWTLAAVGAGLIVISIPFTNKSVKTANESAKMYNSGLQTVSQRNYKPQLEFASMKTGIGFRLSF